MLDQTVFAASNKQISYRKRCLVACLEGRDCRKDQKEKNSQVQKLHFNFSIIIFYRRLVLMLLVCYLFSSEIGRCVALLEDSVSILLSCLESTDSKMVNMAGYFAWNMEEALKCASFFRRIYEEVSDGYVLLFEIIQISL